MRLSSILSLALLPLLSLQAVSASPPLVKRAPDACNGHAELCNRSYGNVTFIGAHDSYGNGSSIVDNQGKGVVDQLNDGVRTLQVQAHKGSDGAIHLCHSSCALLDGGTLTSYLTKVKGWLDSNPNEVITLVIVNSDTIAPSVYSTAFDSAGMIDSVYKPTTATIAVDAWPTLGDMITAGGRVVVFMDYNADFSSVSWIIDEFSNMWEDAYDVTTQDFACNVNRTSGSPSTTLYMTNHFLDSYGNILGISAWVPDKDKLNETNAETGYGSVGTGADNCASLWGRAPNHILLDFYDSNGNAPFNVAARLNGVSAPTNTVVASSISTGSDAAVSSAASTTTAANTAGTAQATSSKLTSGASSDLITSRGGMAAAMAVVAATLLGGTVLMI